MSEVIKQLFTEKFRPSNLAQLIAPPRIKDELRNGLTQNILLYGSPGTGKSSTLFILAENHPTLFVNASSEGGVDTVRNKIPKFCSTMSLEAGKEKLKCVILDELDGATDEFFKALRVIMEKFSNTTRFIASCNYIQKIPEAISESRFHFISYDAINKEEEDYIFGEYVKRIGIILNAAKVSYTDELLKKFVKNEFPDMRALLNKVQSFYLRGVKELDEKNFNVNFDFKDLFDLCLSDSKPYQNYKFISSEYSSRIDDALNALGEDFIEYITSNASDKVSKIPMIIIAVAEHQAQRTQVIDPLITLLSCIYKIQIILHS